MGKNHSSQNRRISFVSEEKIGKKTHKIVVHKRRKKNLKLLLGVGLGIINLVAIDWDFEEEIDFG